MRSIVFIKKINFIWLRPSVYTQRQTLTAYCFYQMYAEQKDIEKLKEEKLESYTKGTQTKESSERNTKM